MTIYKDVNGREFTYSEYSKKVYLDEKRPHVDHLIRHKWPEEKPKRTDDYLVNLPGRKNGESAVMHYSVEWCEWGFRDVNTLITSRHEPVYWWNLPEVGNE